MGLIVTSAVRHGAYCDVGLIVISAVPPSLIVMSALRHGAYCDVGLIVTSLSLLPTRQPQLTFFVYRCSRSEIWQKIQNLHFCMLNYALENMLKIC